MFASATSFTYVKSLVCVPSPKITGASIAAPLASRTIRELKERDLKKIISIAMILLGLATFLKAFGV